MRLDKWLVNTGIVPRRTKAQQAADAGLIEIDGKRAKPSAEVRLGQQIRVSLGLRLTVYEVLAVPERPVQLSFGGADGRTLFMAAWSSVYAVRTVHAGRQTR